MRAKTAYAGSWPARTAEYFSIGLIYCALRRVGIPDRRHGCYLGRFDFSDMSMYLYVILAREAICPAISSIIRFEVSRRAPSISLTTESRTTLDRMVRAPSTSQALVLRGRIVLAAGERTSNQAIAAQLGVTASTVGKWRNKYYLYGIAGLQDWRRGGRPAKYGTQVWEEFRGLLRRPPPDCKPRWTVRDLARQLGLPRSTVQDMLLMERGKLRRKSASPGRRKR